MAVTPLMLDIAEYLQKEMKRQIAIPRASRTYSGQIKPSNAISPRISSGTLERELQVYWVEDFNEESTKPTLVVDFGAAYQYAEYVDQGRRPGKYPPLRAIEKWVTQKRGIQGIRDSKGRFIKRKSLVYLIRRSIGRYGYGGIFFIDRTIEASLDKITEDLGKAAEEFLIKYLEENGTIIPV